jgi:hypothetical protein
MTPTIAMSTMPRFVRLWLKCSLGWASKPRWTPCPKKSSFPGERN